MVNFASFAVFALVPLVANAMPASSTGLSARSEKFSFEKWARDIIADPNGDHLSAREALDAANQGTLKLALYILLIITSRQRVAD